VTLGNLFSIFTPCFSHRYRYKYRFYSTLIYYTDCPGWLWIHHHLSTPWQSGGMLWWVHAMQVEIVPYVALRGLRLSVYYNWVHYSWSSIWLIEDKDRRKVIYWCLSRAGSPAFNPILDLIDLIFSALGSQFRRDFRGALLLTVDCSELWSRFVSILLCYAVFCDATVQAL
jgi:hypothetical protein